VNWLLPGTASVLGTTIEYEQVAVDLTAWVARSEPKPYLRQADEFGVLEDFDHLYRYSNLHEMIEHGADHELLHERRASATCATPSSSRSPIRG
jgi:hypothetical protein